MTTEKEPQGQNARQMIGVIAGWVNVAAMKIAKNEGTITKTDIAVLRSQLDALNALVAAVAKEAK
jgi:hypothetical protein